MILNAESVREFVPRVASTLGTKTIFPDGTNSERVARPSSYQTRRNSFRVANLVMRLLPRVEATLDWNSPTLSA